MDLLNGADAKNQDVVGTIQEQFKRVFSEMNKKYGIRNVEKKKEPDEADLLKYVSEDDLKLL